VPQHERRDDARDHGQDQVGLAEVAALEALRALDLADGHGGDHAQQHHHREHVDHQREPALMAEPRQRGVLAHRSDHRDDDRREEDDEAPEDRGVHQARHEPLEQLALPQHDLGLVADTPGRVPRAIHRLAEPDEVDEQLGAAREQPAADGEGGRQRDRSGEHVYVERPFLSSAVIAGTISVRSPITA
jgi:hypothetical protein